MRFKPGDKVVCVDANDSLGLLDDKKEYTVDRYSLENRARIFLKEIPNNGAWFEYRFILSNEKSKPFGYKKGLNYV